MNEPSEVHDSEVGLESILRLPAVLSRCGLGRSSIYNRIEMGLWPKPISLGSRAVGWPSSEVAAILAARIAGKSNEEIRQIVGQLEASRKSAFSSPSS